MSAGKYTPGPWSIDPKRSFRVIDGDDQTIGRFGTSDMIRDSWEANAQLCAAAPDLLWELQHLVRLLTPRETDGTLDVPGLATLNGARAAITKARGEA